MDCTFQLPSLDDPRHDHLVYVILCAEDGTVLVQNKCKNGSYETSFPTITLGRNEGWSDATRRLARQVKNSTRVINWLS